MKVDTEHGRVTLHGKVSSQAEKDKAEPEPAEEVEQTDPRPFSLSPEIVRGALGQSAAGRAEGTP